jgi:hypothetical protein
MRTRFQKRHYVALAEIVRVAKRRPNDTASEAVADIEQDLIDLFRADNPKFKPDTFRVAATPREACR